MIQQTVEFNLVEESGVQLSESIICDVCKDPKNEYLRIRFMQDYKKIRPLPLKVDIKKIIINS